MKKKFEILDEHDVFESAYFRVKEAHLRHQRFDGQMSEKVIRLKLDRGDSVAAIVHDPSSEQLYFAEQFRYPTVESGSGWLLELPAGSLRPDECPETCIKRELIEEIGFEVQHIEPVGTYYLSPGGCSERLFLYYVTVNDGVRISDGGGVDDEHEDIRVVAAGVEDTMAALTRGGIRDAKTMIGLQWFALRQGK